jgi:hypothetical protein
MMLQMVGRVMAWTLAVGFVCFLIGFVGPMIGAPDANQGPLLGIFYTGPLGLLVGLLTGIVREVLGHTTGPLHVARLHVTRRISLPRLGPGRLHSLAAGGGSLLVFYGAAGVMRGEGRGAASAAVIGGALIWYGLSGRVPAWLLRNSD